MQYHNRKISCKMMKLGVLRNLFVSVTSVSLVLITCYSVVLFVFINSTFTVWSVVCDIYFTWLCTYAFRHCVVCIMVHIYFVRVNFYVSLIHMTWPCTYTSRYCFMFYYNVFVFSSSIFANALPVCPFVFLVNCLYNDIAFLEEIHNTHINKRQEG